MRYFLGIAHERFPPSECLAQKQKAIISSDPDEHVSRIEELQKLGATTIALMNCSGAAPQEAIRVYGEHVLPKLRS